MQKDCKNIFLCNIRIGKVIHYKMEIGLGKINNIFPKPICLFMNTIDIVLYIEEGDTLFTNFSVIPIKILS